eukprot:10550293-Ditylum_brightwellii.AAC.1
MQDKREKNTQSGSANGGGRLHCYNQDKLNAIIGKSIKAALKSQHKDCTHHKEHNAINKFNACSLSSSNNNDVSCT